MNQTMTKREARQILGAASDYALAKIIGTTHQAVYKWGGDDDPIPQQRDWQIRLMMAERKSA